MAGLLAAPKKHMIPCFALLLLLLVADVASFVAPFYASRFSDSAWGTPDRMGFLARAMAASLAFGFVSAVAADRRNRSAWWFLLGHAGFPLALVLAIAGMDLPVPPGAPGAGPLRGPAGALAAVITTGFVGAVLALVLTRKPLPAPAPLDPVLARISRLMFRWGNIWFGITLMFAIGVTVAAGTFLENKYGTKSAQYLVYRSPWFGAIFFTGGMAMLCATFRKYPFRLEQAGWLTVHSGLALVVIGGMASFLSSVEGDVSIREGAMADTFQSSTQSRLALDAVAQRANGTRMIRPLLRTIADFDVDPSRTEPGRAYEVETAHGEPPVRLVVDRYFGSGLPFTKWTDTGARDRLGLELELRMGRSEEPDTVRLEEENARQATLPFGEKGFPITLFRATPRMFEALLRKERPADHGRIVVRDERGEEVVSVPVRPGPGARENDAPAALADVIRIPGTSLDVRLLSYYDNMRPGRRAPIDASPGNPQNPAVVLEIAGTEGADKHTALAYLDDDAPAAASRAPRKHPYRVGYEAAPRIELQGPQLLLVDLGGQLEWVFVSSSGERTTGDVTMGADLPLPMPAFRIRPATIYRRLAIDDGFEFIGYKAEAQVIRVSVAAADGVTASPIWLKLGGRRTFALGDRTFTLSWMPTAHALGFSLRLHDFHRDFYPGSSEESTFESYCRLWHPAKFADGVDIKIDMNHPLRLDGWRLFQSRFSPDGRTTILQVNRDPGLAITYPACAVVTLGLVVVFFMKRTLRLKREELQARGAAPALHLAWALGSIAAVGIGPFVFGVYAATHEALGLPLAGAPAFAFGLLLLLVAPMTVVWFYVRPMARRLRIALGSPVAAGGIA